MTQQKRTMLDDLIEVGRKLIEQLDEAITPDKQRKPARVPVPVRNDQPRPKRTSYDDDPYGYQ